MLGQIDALPARVSGVALVEEQHGGGAGRSRVLGLELEGAGAALDQGDGAGREPREVTRLAFCPAPPVPQLMRQRHASA